MTRYPETGPPGDQAPGRSGTTAPDPAAVRRADYGGATWAINQLVIGIPATGGE